MRERFQLPIPMWRVHFQLLGGNRKLLGIATLYLAAWMVGLLGFRRLVGDEMSTADFASGSLVALTVIQLILLVIAGCNAVHRATLRDYTTKMIESHRLSPMPNMTVVVGYLFGTTLQVQMLFVVNAFIGMPLTILAGFNLADWLYGNCIAANGALTLWAITVFAGVGLRKPVSPAAIIVLIGIVGNAALVFLPAAGLFLSAYPILLGGMAMMGQGRLNGSQLILIGSVNAILTAFWMTAAAAKYRRPDLPALNALRGTLLLMLWLVLGTVGMVAGNAGMRLGTLGPMQPGMLLGQWITTMVLALPVAAVMLNGAVQCATRAGGDANLRDRWDRASTWTVAIGSAVAICAVMAGIGQSVWPRFLQSKMHWEPNTFVYMFFWSLTLLACTLGMLTLRGVLVGFYAATRSPKMMSTVFIGLLWIGPPAIDLIRSITMYEYGPGESWLFACSPPGALIAIWGPVSEPWLLPGLVIQSILMLLATAFAQRMQTKRLSPLNP